MEVPKDKANTKISDATTLVELLDVTKVNLFFELCVLKMWKPWDGKILQRLQRIIKLHRSKMSFLVPNHSYIVLSSFFL